MNASFRVDYGWRCFLVVALFLSCSCSGRPRHQEAVVLYFNDAHQIMPVSDSFGERGGVARLKTVIDRLRRANPETIVVFGGDLAGGTLFGGVFRGLPMVDAFNSIGVDFANFGQHDFDFGIDNALGLLDRSRFQWFTSNLLGHDGAPFAGLPAVVTATLSGIRIGFIGLTDSMHTTMNEGRIRQRDLLDAATSAVASLEAMRVDAIVAIAQTDLETNERILVENPSVLAVLTEEQAENRSVVTFVGSRPVASPCGNLGSVIRLALLRGRTQVQTRIEVLPVDAQVTPDPELKAMEEKYQAELDRVFGVTIAHSVRALDAGIPGDHAVRWRETAIGNLIADAFRAHHGADIGLINGGGVRGSIPEDDVQLRDLYAVLPFRNKVCLVELSGEQLLRCIEHGLAAIQDLGGGFLQVSGLRYTFDRGRAPGDRLIDAWVNSIPVQDDRPYTVALPSHLLAGGDGFDVFQKSRVIVGPDRAPLDVEVLVAYCDSLGSIEMPDEGAGRIVAKSTDENHQRGGAATRRSYAGQSEGGL